MHKLSIIKYGLFFFILIASPLTGGRDGAARPSWEYYYEKGQTQYRLGMYEYAVNTLVICFDMNPKSYQAANLLGDVYCKLNQKHLAIPWYEKSLAVNDNQADIHYRVGVLYEFFSDNDAAFRHFSRTVEIDPVHEKARCSLVRYHILRNDREAAKNNFEISAREGKTRSGKALSAAVRAEKSGNDKKAAGLFTQIIEESPCVIDAYMNLFELYRRRKEYDEAAAVLERLKKIKPDYEKAYVLLGYVYFTQKMHGKRKFRIDQALDNLKKAAELNPDNFEACYSISEIYAYIKKDIESRAWEEKGRRIEERLNGAQRAE